jgi:hypothetical protein
MDGKRHNNYFNWNTSGFSLAFIFDYADSQYGYHRVWDDAAWWLDKVIPPLAIIVAIIVFMSE